MRLIAVVGPLPAAVGHRRARGPPVRTIRVGAEGGGLVLADEAAAERGGLAGGVSRGDGIGDGQAEAGLRGHFGRAASAAREHLDLDPEVRCIVELDFLPTGGAEFMHVGAGDIVGFLLVARVQVVDEEIDVDVREPSEDDGRGRVVGGGTTPRPVSSRLPVAAASSSMAPSGSTLGRAHAGGVGRERTRRSKLAAIRLSSSGWAALAEGRMFAITDSPCQESHGMDRRLRSLRLGSNGSLPAPHWLAESSAANPSRLLATTPLTSGSATAKIFVSTIDEVTRITTSERDKPASRPSAHREPGRHLVFAWDRTASFEAAPSPCRQRWRDRIRSMMPARDPEVRAETPATMCNSISGGGRRAASDGMACSSLVSEPYNAAEREIVT